MFEKINAICLNTSVFWLKITVSILLLFNLTGLAANGTGLVY